MFVGTRGHSLRGLSVVIACVTISQEELLQRMAWGDSADSQGGASLTITGNLEIPQAVTLPVDEAKVVLVNFRVADEPSFRNLVALGEEAAEGRASQLVLGTERPFQLELASTPDPTHFSEGVDQGEELALYLLGAYADEVFVGANVSQFLCYARGLHQRGRGIGGGGAGDLGVASVHVPAAGLCGRQGPTR